MNWAHFIRTHMAVLGRIDFFTVEVLTWRGLATYCVLFFLHLETRRVRIGGITQHPPSNGWRTVRKLKAVRSRNWNPFETTRFGSSITAGLRPDVKD